VFTDNLIRSRHQLASNFETKLSDVSPESQGTDIIGGLWHMKTVFDSYSTPDTPPLPSRTIWIFSDMVNETQTFPIPTLVQIGPERMLVRARAKGLLVPLKGYKIYVRGASPSGLSPQAWITIRDFWKMYFLACGAELVSYSAEPDAER
jgi:hypothetical protein